MLRFKKWEKYKILISLSGISLISISNIVFVLHNCRSQPLGSDPILGCGSVKIGHDLWPLIFMKSYCIHNSIFTETLQLKKHSNRHFKAMLRIAITKSIEARIDKLEPDSGAEKPLVCTGTILLYACKIKLLPCTCITFPPAHMGHLISLV